MQISGGIMEELIFQNTGNETLPQENEKKEIPIAEENPTQDVIEIPLAQIVPDKNQTRKEFPTQEIEALAQSIRMHGLVTPILVVPLIDTENQYKIIDGERRYRALSILAKQFPEMERYKKIPVSLIKEDNPIFGKLVNMARKVFNPMETAEALNFMKNNGNYSDEQLGKLVEKGRSSVSEYLSLLKLPEQIRDKAKKESYVPFRVLKKLVAKNIPDEDKILEYNKLHKSYTPSTTTRERKEDAKSPWNADRLVPGVQKKMEGIINSLERIDFTQIEQNREALKSSIDTLIDKLSSMREILDNHTS